MSDIPDRARRKPVKLYYCGTSFFVKNSHKEWMGITDTVAKHYLIKAGFAAGKSVDRLTPADAQLLVVRDRDSVDSAAQVAGQKTGLLNYNGNRVLVTKEATLPLAFPGEFPLWDEILSTHYAEHLPYVLEWHKRAYVRVLEGGGPMLPALAIAGATGTGKSLTGNLLTRHLLGGRLANPLRYMMGETTFNEDVCGSETLLLDDVPARMHKDSLDSFLGHFKQMIASPFESMHPKGKSAFPVPVVRALIVAMNDEGHNFRILPLDDEDLNDKLMLLRVRARPACLPQSDGQEQTAFEKKLIKEIPHVLWHLLHVFKLPAGMGWKRGDACFRDPVLLAKAFENDAVSRVLWLFDKLPMLSTAAKTAHEWDRQLREELNGLADGILDNGKYPLSLGHVLRSAAKRFPKRVQLDSEQGHAGVSKWLVQRAA